MRTWDTTQSTGQGNRLPLQVKIAIVVPHLVHGRGTQTFGTRAVLPLTWGLNHAIYNP